MRVPDWRWKKASKSGQQTDCVELARDVHGDVVAVRDSKAPTAGALTAGVVELVAAVRDGRL